MNGITLEQLSQITLPTTYIDEIIKNGIKIAKLEELRADIGDELFSQLSEEDKIFIIDTEGMVDLGYEVSEKDLNRIFRHIEEYGE